jgi:integrase
VVTALREWASPASCGAYCPPRVRPRRGRRPTTAPLFVGANSERITRGTLQYRVLRAFRRAGIDSDRARGALVHGLRHAFDELVVRGLHRMHHLAAGKNVAAVSIWDSPWSPESVGPCWDTPGELG